jgi:AcrR family transcriptional regulator
MSAVETAKRRRPPGEVQRLILDAARTLFASKGYAGTSTREIAEHAGVYEPMVYRRFPSKAKLFEAAVLEPFNGVISDYLKAWQAQAEAPATTEELVRQFVVPLYRVLSGHRELVLALIAAQEFHAAVSDGAGESDLSQLLERLEPQLEIEAARRPLREFDIPVTLRISVGMIMGVAVLDQWLFPTAAKRPDEERVLEELVQFCLYGVTARSSDGGAGGPEDGRGGPPSPEVARLLDRLAEAERRAIRAELELEHVTGRLTPPAARDRG